jgi:hypothetical protein
MPMPDLLSYSSHVEYLKDYLRFRASQNPNFNSSLWAKKLKFSNLASLTRILSGVRAPGPRILAALCDYLEFDATERGYFETLVRLRSEKAPAMRELCEQKLNQMRKEAGRIRPLAKLRARNLILWGTADPQALAEFLGQRGYESLLGYAGTLSPVCLNGAWVYESELGAFGQFCLAVYVRRKHRPWADSEIYFPFLYASDAQVAAAFRRWGSPYRTMKMRHELEPGRAPLRFVGAGARTDAIEISMGASRIALRKQDQPNDVFGYNDLLGPARAFPLSFASSAQYREFDPKVDHCEWSDRFAVGEVLSRIEFKPTLWTYQAKFACAIFTPEERPG